MIRKLVGNSALVAVGLIGALLVVECGVALAPRSILPRPLHDLVEEMDARIHSRDDYLPDPALWYVIRPNTDVIASNTDHSFRMKTNLNFPHAGFRGGTSGGHVWGVAVGDSFTFAYGVDQEASWVARLTALSKREIINLGVPGYGPQQYTRSLQQYGIQFKPKIVFYGLFANDLANSEVFDRLDGNFAAFSARSFLREHSVIFNLFRKFRRSTRAKPEDIELADVGLKFNSDQLKRTLTEQSDRLPKDWPIAAREIDKAIRESERNNAIFVLFYFPAKEEVYWDDISQFSSLGSLNDRIVEFEKKVSTFCRSRLILCLDLTPALKRRAARHEQLYFTVDTHWNELGNRVVAEDISRFLQENKIL